MFKDCCSDYNLQCKYKPHPIPPHPTPPSPPKPNTKNTSCLNKCGKEVTSGCQCNDILCKDKNLKSLCCSD